MADCYIAGRSGLGCGGQGRYVSDGLEAGFSTYGTMAETMRGERSGLSVTLNGVGTFEFRIKVNSVPSSGKAGIIELGNYTSGSGNRVGCFSVAVNTNSPVSSGCYALEIGVNDKWLAYGSGTWIYADPIIDTLLLGQVYTISICVNGEVIMLYIDGERVDDGTAILPEGAPFLGTEVTKCMFMQSFISGRELTGELYSARIYDRVLDNDEILQNYTFDVGNYV